jgi:hypothetical protein
MQKLWRTRNILWKARENRSLKNWPAKQMRSGQPPDRIVRGISRPAVPPPGSERADGTGPTALTGSATFTSTCCRALIQRINSPQPLWWPAARPAQGARSGGGRNARATHTRSRAFQISPGNSPSRIAGCHRRHRKHRSASVERSNVFVDPLWSRMLRAATEKHCTLVQKLWTVSLPCGRLRKTKRQFPSV